MPNKRLEWKTFRLWAFPLRALQTQEPEKADGVYFGKNRQERGQLTWILTEAALKAHVTI